MPSNNVRQDIWTPPAAKFSVGVVSYFKTFNFWEILLCALRDFEKQTSSLSSSLNNRCNYYYIVYCNMSICKECNMEKNWEATEAVNTPYLKKMAKQVFLN